jgi:hypothetical protein
MNTPVVVLDDHLRLGIETRGQQVTAQLDCEQARVLGKMLIELAGQASRATFRKAEEDTRVA